MQPLRYGRHLAYGVAIAGAPFLCLLYGILFGQKTPNLFWFLGDIRAFALLILFYPVIEELTFRGLVQEYLRKKTEGKYLVPQLLSAANAVTSLLFALIHLVHHTPVWALLVFFPSLLFGYFKERYGSIFPVIFLHSYYNMVCFAWVR